MSPMNIMAGIGVVIVICLVIIFAIPEEKNKPQKKKKHKHKKVDAPKPLEPQKDYEAIIKRNQNHISKLKNQVMQLERTIGERNKDLLVEQAKANKFQERLQKERHWIEKKEGGVEKKVNDMRQTQTDLKNLQEQFGEEHGLTIRLKKELKEVKKQNELLSEQRRLAEGESLQLKSKGDNYRKEIAHLKKDVAILSKKKMDETFVAKSDYLDIEKKLKETEIELQRVVRDKKDNS
ncbi:MAG: chromosome segregation ATPase [Candidatus Omnitrophota bacterium]|jgi:chromosome segregation ATPase